MIVLVENLALCQEFLVRESPSTERLEGRVLCPKHVVVGEQLQYEEEEEKEADESNVRSMLCVEKTDLP